MGSPGEGLSEDAVGARVVARITRLARALEIRQAKLGGALLVGGLLAQALLERADLAVGGRDTAWDDIASASRCCRSPPDLLHLTGDGGARQARRPAPPGRKT